VSKPNRKVLRLQQMRAQVAQAAGIKYVDLVYEIPSGDPLAEPVERTCSFLTQDYWPVDVVRSVDDAGGNSAQIEVLRKVASPPEAFDELVSVAGLTVGELKELIDELGKEAGTSEGEGAGSSNSSTSTQEPSAPTSSATTPAAA
jgi:hypothetical protein